MLNTTLLITVGVIALQIGMVLYRLEEGRPRWLIVLMPTIASASVFGIVMAFVLIHWWTRG